MNTFNKKSLYVTLASLGALGVSGAAEAVNVNPDGLGQVLIYPYYTTQNKVAGANPFNSLLSVVNSTATAKVVKVRFLEGKASKEVLDFNLWLSKFDVWTAAIIPSGTGAGIFTTDLSCTVPKVSSSAATPTNFVNYAYAGLDPLPSTLDRTKEGYVEIIEMGDVTGATAVAVTHVQPSPPGLPPARSATTGECPNLPNSPATPADVIPGSGGLFGGMTLINVLAGEDYSSDATALANFSATTLWAEAGNVQPDLTRVNPKVSVVFNNNTVVTTNWPTLTTQPQDPVSAVLMHDNVMNEFVLDAATKSGTDWVITMPTKRFYYTGNSTTVVPVTKLFQRNLTSVGACDDISLTQWNREENTPTTPQGFSPPASPDSPTGLCFETTVLTWNNSSVLGSVNSVNQPTSFPNGWARINISAIAGAAPRDHTLVGGATVIASINSTTGAITTTPLASSTYTGLPIIGFAVQSFTNGSLPSGTTTVLSNYGGDFDHKYTRLIQ